MPRDQLLDLLDELRECLPEEVQQAGAIVEQRTEILQQAQAEAERLTGRTRSETDLAEWTGPRAGTGKMAPRGFPRAGHPAYPPRRSPARRYNVPLYLPKR